MKERMWEVVARGTFVTPCHGSPLASSYDLGQCLTGLWFGEMLTECNKEDGRRSPVLIRGRGDGQTGECRKMYQSHGVL